MTDLKGSQVPQSNTKQSYLEVKQNDLWAKGHKILCLLTNQKDEEFPYGRKIHTYPS